MKACARAMEEGFCLHAFSRRQTRFTAFVPAKRPSRIKPGHRRPCLVQGKQAGIRNIQKHGSVLLINHGVRQERDRWRAHPEGYWMAPVLLTAACYDSPQVSSFGSGCWSVPLDFARSGSGWHSLNRRSWIQRGNPRRFLRLVTHDPSPIQCHARDAGTGPRRLE